MKLTLDIVGEFEMHASDHYTSDPKSSFAAAVAEGKEEDDPPEVSLCKERAVEDEDEATDHGELPKLLASGCSDARLGIRETSELEPSAASVGSASTSAAGSRHPIDLNEWDSRAPSIRSVRGRCRWLPVRSPFSRGV